MGPSDEPLAELRRRLREAPEPELERLVVQLRGDPRRGARALAAAARRRLDAAAAERERLAALFARRHELSQRGARAVAGVDEVGMGPLAGPVVACAVVLGDRPWLPGLNDSKRLSPALRERLAQHIRAQARAVSLGCVAPAEIDALNVFRAGLEAMRRAVVGLSLPPDHVLVDARTIPGLPMRQSAIVGGDACDGSIAAASIVAKVHRDALMRRLHERFPEYGFDRHKGYPTPEHLAALRRHGPSPEHRRSFAPVAALV